MTFMDSILAHNTFFLLNYVQVLIHVCFSVGKEVILFNRFYFEEYSVMSQGWLLIPSKLL